MLDFRMETFITLCETRNYTKTAEILHITQPAVTQHIKHLEEYYGEKLFTYCGRSLTLTEHGELLEAFAMPLVTSTNKVKVLMKELKGKKISINFGATLTVGEYSMPTIIEKIMKEFPTAHITMLVENTQILLEKLHHGEIDFAIIEGNFDKTQYCAKAFSMESFVAVCAKQNKFATSIIKMEDLVEERLIIREQGSGTRDIFEQVLYEKNMTIDSFDRVIELANMNGIKQLVEKNLGITFLYKKAVEKELQEHRLELMQIQGLDIKREFNFVFLKNSLHEEEYNTWFHFMKP